MPDDPRFLSDTEGSQVRERVRQAGQNQPLRPGALCPNCGGHAFRRAELKASTPCPKCGQTPSRLAA